MLNTQCKKAVWRPQFYIWHVLAITFVAALVCGHFTSQRPSEKPQRPSENVRLIAAHVIHQSGGAFYFEDELVPDGWPKNLFNYDPAMTERVDRVSSGRGVVAMVQCCNSRLGDDGLQKISKLSEIRNLDIGDCFITDSGIKYLAQLSDLKILRLDGTQVDDNGLKYLACLQRLTKLYLCRTKVSDGGIRHLLNLRTLKVLYSPQLQISDESVAQITKALKLCDLTLDGAFLSKKGLRSFASCNELTSLCIANLSASEDVLRELSNAIPTCHIIANGKGWFQGKRDDIHKGDSIHIKGTR